MNTTEKAGVILAAILIIGGVFYYQLPNTYRSSAAGTPPLLIPPYCNVYISSSINASDANNGSTILTPVRTIRRSFALANNCKSSNIKFLDDSYEVLGSDLDQGMPTNPSITLGDYVETINVSPNQSGAVRIFGLPETLRKGDTIIIEDSQNVNAKCKLAISRFIFDMVSLSLTSSHDVSLMIVNNTFVDPKPIQQASLWIVGTTGSNVVTNNIFKIEQEANIGLILGLVTLANPTAAVISGNTFLFGNKSAYDTNQFQEAMGIYINLSGTNTTVSITNNTFSTPNAVFPGNDINPKLFGIATSFNQANLKIQNNLFSHYYGVNISLRDFSDPSENIIQKIDISNNYETDN